MRLLLDTHIALWAVYQSDRLPGPARLLLQDQCAEVYFSVVSLWEITIKGMKYPGQLPSSGTARKDFLDAGMKEWPLRGDVFAGLEALPPLHHDPFDRLLVATAFTEPMRFLTVDRLLGNYDIGHDLIVVL
ncbi:type II toxin-antitoxin system VapC family toxin [Acidithiobacillus sp. MC6.1]|nr:type II toxin-antitoxin system VapC family toxin [Acidithiobacillus sp. MC6.1]